MSAREMFEELEYIKEEDMNEIRYKNHRQFISFNKNSFIIYQNGIGNNKGFIFNNNKIIKAIQQQIKELGWED